MSELYLTNVRLSFPKIVEAAGIPNMPTATKKYSADLIIDKNDPQFAKFMAEVQRLAAEKWKENAGVILGQTQNDRKLRCFGNGSEKINKKTLKVYEGYENANYLTASSDEDRPPVLVRADGTVVDNANTMERQQLARKLYGGCYVNVAVSPWIQDNQFGRAVRCQLVAIQFSKDGAPFGEAPPDLTGKFGAVAESVPVPPAPAGMPSFFG